MYIHKDKELQDMERHYPAQHYVLVDDKLPILSAVKIWGARGTTVHVQQGHYNHEPSPSIRLPISRSHESGNSLSCTREDLLSPRDRDFTPSQAGYRSATRAGHVASTEACVTGWRSGCLRKACYSPTRTSSPFSRQ